MLVYAIFYPQSRTLYKYAGNESTQLAINQWKMTIYTCKRHLTEEQNNNGNISYLSYQKDNLIIQNIILVITDIYTQYL